MTKQETTPQNTNNQMQHNHNNEQQQLKQKHKTTMTKLIKNILRNYKRELQATLTLNLGHSRTF